MATLYRNGVIFTPDSDQSDNWLLIKDGKVSQRGQGDFEGQFDNVVDLEGKSIIPGLGDAHMHVADVGWGKEILDLHQSKSKEYFLKLLEGQG